MVEGKTSQICLRQVELTAASSTPTHAQARAGTRSEQIVTVQPGADSLILVLHADVGERLLGRTVTDYRLHLDRSS